MMFDGWIEQPRKTVGWATLGTGYQPLFDGKGASRCRGSVRGRGNDSDTTSSGDLCDHDQPAKQRCPAPVANSARP
ncbi:hypothetical protein XA68_14685 [Ophiocordyceps unilateralis]|uniref:Uncharacterized protein n=1 Tax=Ophiocordyceps unilateralis TaxID=268505 RepID=A0A2A9P9U9_OPHUN|nr:hypothetical protein XA68_14685 [Ophiocordyceps unilateralis]